MVLLYSTTNSQQQDTGNHRTRTSNSSSSSSSRPPLLPSENNNNGVAVSSKVVVTTAGFPSSSSKTNNNAHLITTTSSSNGKPKSKTVSSRYMSPSPTSSRRFPSPSVVTRVTNSSSILPTKRSVSADRRRSSSHVRPSSLLTPDLVSKNVGTSNASVVVSAATKTLITSTRSLSVSFQGESFSLPVSKTRVVVVPPTPSSSSSSSSPGLRKGTTPERRRTSTTTSTPLRGGGGAGGGDHQVENNSNKTSDQQHRWPAKNRAVNTLARSLDCSGERRSMGSGNSIRGLQKSMIDERRTSLEGGRSSLDLGNSIRGLQKSMIDERRTSFDGGRSSLDLGNSIRGLGKSMIDERRPSLDGVGRLSLDLGNSEPLLKINGNYDLAASDSDSVSSGSTSGVQECGGRAGPRGIAGSAKFWQETNSRLRRLQDHIGSPLSISPGSKLMPKMKRYTCSDGNGPLSSPRTMMSSPIRGAGIRPASPSKLMMTPVGSSPSSRGNSPSRIRNNAVSTISNSFNEMPSVLSFAVDVRRGKSVGENRIVDAHLLRLVYNRHVQWRFVNARTELVLLVQRRKSEKNLWNAWITISDLRDTVTKKRHRLQLLKQKLKLASILRRQMTVLEDWASMDKDHSVSLLGAIEALKANTLRLPVLGGAVVDPQGLKDAIGSAVNVMHAMASSICLLLPTVEEMNSLVSELSKVIAKERALLEQCTDFISLLAAMQVRDSSLRTHILQLHNRV